MNSAPELHRAIYKGNIAFVIKAIMKGEDSPDTRDSKGRTALHIACMKGRLRIAKYLLRFQNADMNAKDDEGFTPLERTPEKWAGPMKLLFSEIEAFRQSKQRRLEGSGSTVDVEDDDASREEEVSVSALKKVVACLLLPLMVLLLVNGWFFALKFLIGTLGFYVVVLGFIVSEVSVRPPWYYHQLVSNTDNLRMVGCPLYWKGWITDPMTDLGLFYENVHFKSTNKFILRGWHILPPESGGLHSSTGPSPMRTRQGSPALVGQKIVHADAEGPLPAPRRSLLKRNNSSFVYSREENEASGDPALSQSAPPVAKRRVGLVLVHGGGRDRRAWLRHSYFLHEAGYGCLLFDLREHGLSSGKMRGFSYGLQERYDVVAAANFMRCQLHYDTVVVIGTSVGGSAAIMAGAIDKSIAGVIAENPFTTCGALLEYQLKTYLGTYMGHHKLSEFLFRMFRRMCVFWLNWRVGNFPVKRCEALHCIDSISPRPVLLMHGTSDSLVPYRHSEILYERAKEPKELYLCDSAYHCGLYNTHPEEYEKTVLDFLASIEAGQTSVGSPSLVHTPPTLEKAEEEKTKAEVHRKKA